MLVKFEQNRMVQITRYFDLFDKKQKTKTKTKKQKQKKNKQTKKNSFLQPFLTKC